MDLESVKVRAEGAEGMRRAGSCRRKRKQRGCPSAYQYLQYLPISRSLILAILLIVRATCVQLAGKEASLGYEGGGVGG